MSRDITTVGGTSGRSPVEELSAALQRIQQELITIRQDQGSIAATQHEMRMDQHSDPLPSIRDVESRLGTLEDVLLDETGRGTISKILVREASNFLDTAQQEVIEIRRKAERKEADALAAEKRANERIEDVRVWTWLRAGITAAFAIVPVLLLTGMLWIAMAIAPVRTAAWFNEAVSPTMARHIDNCIVRIEYSGVHHTRIRWCKEHARSGDQNSVGYFTRAIFYDYDKARRDREAYEKMTNVERYATHINELFGLNNGETWIAKDRNDRSAGIILVDEAGNILEENEMPKNYFQ